jgi:hypothetical protein
MPENETFFWEQRHDEAATRCYIDMKTLWETALTSILNRHAGVEEHESWEVEDSVFGRQLGVGRLDELDVVLVSVVVDGLQLLQDPIADFAIGTICAQKLASKRCDRERFGWERKLTEEDREVVHFVDQSLQSSAVDALDDGVR